MKKRIPQREFLFVLTLLVITITSFLVWQLNKKEGEYKPGVNAEADQAVNAAKVVYQQQKRLKVDLSNGPCLSNDLIKDDWVADLVHNPAELIDRLPEIQCPALLDGTATRLVELDLEGNVVRVK